MRPTVRHATTHRWVVAALVAMFLLGSPTTAFAHNAVEDRDPAADSVVTLSPVTVSVTANDNFLDTGDATRGFAIVARDTTGLYYGDGCVNINERTMSATLGLGEPGAYTVLYQFVSADGHTLQESYAFFFEPSSDHVPAAGLSEPPMCGESPKDLPVEQTAPEVVGPLDAPQAVADESVSLIPTVAGVIALTVLLIALGVSSRRKRRAQN
jgi:methionine-rich copper-binding protein CopC